MKQNRSILLRGAAGLLFVVLLAVFGLLLTFQIANVQKDNYFVQRKIQATTAAAALDYRDIQALTGGPADIGTPAYATLLGQLVRIKRSDAGVRFVYLMRPQDKKMIFLVDAEDPSSPDYSPPGQEYKEAKPSDFLPFKKNMKPETEISDPLQDEYGNWISASAYILDNTGQAVAVLGTDVAVDKAFSSFNEIKRLGILFNLLAVGLLGLVAAQYLYWLHGRDKQRLLREEMEESVQQLNDELLKADKMKSEFIQLASHELRNPVNALNVAIQALDRSAKPMLTEDQQSLIDVARKGTSRLVDLVNDLLDMTLLEAGDFNMQAVQTDAAQVVTDTVQLFRPMANKKGLMLTATVPEGPVKASVDPKVLFRILENLVGNAVNYTDFGKVDVRLEPGQQTLRFEVSDSGPGIPEGFRDELFTKFSKLERARPGQPAGSGIGLALCKSMVEALGGKIWCESSEGKGSTFIFELPRNQKPAKGSEG